MSRILNTASVAAVALTASAMLLLTEPGRASDLAEAPVTQIALPVAAAPVEPVISPASAPAELPATEIAAPSVPVVAAPADSSENRPASLAELVAATAMPATLDEQTRCLAGAIYFESRSESLIGQLAVAHVVINRAESGRFARTLCGVVYQKSQFSFVRGGTMPAINTGGKQWRNAVAIAQIALESSWKNQAPGALYFHARHVSPGWNRPRVAQIDNHIFYR